MAVSAGAVHGSVSSESIRSRASNSSLFSTESADGDGLTNEERRQRKREMMVQEERSMKELFIRDICFFSVRSAAERKGGARSGVARATGAIERGQQVASLAESTLKLPHIVSTRRTAS